MSDKQVALIIDDSGQLNGAALFEPELTVQTVGGIADGVAYMTAHRAIAIIVINTEASMADRIALLRLIRATATCAGSIVAVVIDNRDTASIDALCEEGADEIIMRQMDASVHILQLQKLLRMHRGHQLTETRRRANQLHAVIEGLSTGVGIFAYEDGKMRALYMNESFVQGARLFLHMQGDSQEDALALLPPREAGIIQNALVANLKDGVPIDMVFHPQTENPQQMALRLRALPIHYEGHESPVFLVHLVDVTDQQIVETALEESNQKLAALMDAVPGGIALFDFEATPRLLYHNETLCQMLGYTEEEFTLLIADHINRLIDPRDRQKMIDLIDTFRKDRKPMEAVFRALNRDGSIRWLRVNTSSMGQGLLCSAVFIDVTSEKESEAKSIRMLNELTHAAEHDALTGIANREGFYRMTSELLLRDPDTAYTILIMDIDRFRVVNDMFGNDVGDQILIAIAQGMAHLLAPIGTCGRLGSDRFVACFPQRLLNIDRIMRLVDQGLKRQKLDYHIQMSFGIYTISDPGVPVHQMCDRATIALKTIKGYAVQHYAVYDEHLRLSMLEESNILDEMYGALSHNQFQIYLQPIFSVETRQPVSAEVLVRWQHPEKGLIAPSRFIPLFERNGFITRLDLHVLEETCRMLASWQRRNYPMPVSVNLSRIDLYNTHLTDYLLEMLERYGVSPSQLRLELTESAYSKDPDALILAINRLRAAGFSILMDDFGSGYSSLNVLMDMPVDMIKLDMRFLAQLNVNPRAASILTSVVRMAKWLHMPVVAEGVETPDQFSFLRSIGCDHVQGYLLAKPMPLSQYTEQYITAVTTPFDTELPAPHSSVDLTCLWDGSPQTDTLFNGMIGAMGIYELSDGMLEVRRVNDGYFELFGATPKQVFENAQDGLTDIHPDDRESLLAQCRHAMETGRVERSTYRHIHTRSGRQPWLETRIRHLGTAGLNNVFAISFTDVTEQKEFEQARTLKNYAMVLRTVYSSVFELNLTQGASRAVHLADGQHAMPDHEQPLEALKAWLSDILLEEDDELTGLILTPGYLNRLVRESASGYYLTERRVRSAQPEGSWASFTFIRVPSDEAAEVYLMCVADVDSRKRADELLQDNRWLQRKQTELAHYQSMMEHLGTSLLEWDVRNMAVTASGGLANYALSTFDFKRFTSHKDLEPYVYQSDLSIFRMFVNDVIAHGNAAVTIRLLDLSGQPVWCRVLCSLLLGNGTKVARFVAAINRIDEQMKIRENYLEEQARFQAFSDNFLFGLGVYEVSNEKHRIMFLSNGYRKIVGFDDDEPLAEETHSFLGVHPDDIPRFKAATNEMLQTGKPYTIDYRVSHKDGHTLWLRSRNAVYPGTKQGQYRIFAVIQNITELHTLQGRMQGLIEHLPAAVAIYDLSAESRTLMQTRHMEATAAAGKPIALDADALSRIRWAYEQGRRELDEVMTLSLPTGETQCARVLATMVPSEGTPLCYCAVVPLQA